MYPTLLPELSHNGVYERIAGACVAPRVQVRLVLVPLDLATDRVALDAVEVGYVSAVEVEPLAKKHLTLERHRRLRVLLRLAVDVLEFVEEETRAQTAELEVGREHGGARLETVGACFGLLEGAHPRLVGQRRSHAPQCFALATRKHARRVELC